MVQSIDEVRRRQRSAGGGGRVPPHNLQAEESLLGAMLLSRDAIAAVNEVRLSPDDFYKPTHGHIYEAIERLYERGDPADPVTVSEELRREGLLDAIGGSSALVSLQSGTPATSNALRYARIVEEHALLRRLIGVAGEIAEIGFGMPEDVTDAVDRAEAMVFEVAQHRVSDSMAPLRDLLSANLDRLEALYERGESITGIPTGYLDLDEQLSGLQPSSLVVVGARPAMGKCVRHDTLLPDPRTGALRTIEEVYREGASGGEPEVLSLSDAWRVQPTRPSAFVDDGMKRCYRVRTRLGREISVTLSHPFLTPSGWRPLGEITVGTRVGVPRQLATFGNDPLPDAEVALLGYLIGDGGLTGVTAKFTNGNDAVIEDARAHTESLGAALVWEAPAGRAATYRLVHRRGHANPVAAMLRRHGLFGVSSHGKHIPAAVYRLPRRQVAMFLSRLFATDGTAWWCDSGDGYGRIAYSSVSRSLITGVQHLLLRFGIVARVRRRLIAYRGERRPAWELEIMAAPDIIRFAEQIGIFGKETAVARLVAKVRTKAAGWTADTVPVEVWDGVLAAKGAQSWAEVSVAAGKPRNHNWHMGRRSPRRDTVARLAAVLGDDRVARHADNDIYWDQIVSIVDDGEHQVYDLTVPHVHNFVAADFFVHNTSFALGLAAHAALEARRPVLLFSLEMGHLELTQRLLCAEARVDASRMRNGRLHEGDWAKINNAIGKLAEAPIYIDDNPNTTVMEIRAKARRLKSRIGDLGLIVVDYLQLMTGRSNAENRQVEVAEISRGLKILARELEVPVVALSQLSRALEMRADKRPMLADLRESGAVEQDADVVMFIYRDEIYNAESPDRGIAEVIVSKHRNGPTGTCRLTFLPHYTKFANMARGV